MGKRIRAWGGLGTKGRPKLQQDIEALADKRKRRKKFETVTASNLKRVYRGKRPRSITEWDLDQFRSIDQRIRRLQGRVADMRVKAREVEASGTGNVKAAATYRQVADEYLKQIAQLQKRLKKGGD